MHFAFLEIGTSDFDTIMENVSDDVVGISVEPVKYYLDELPNKSNVLKINCAISDYDGEIQVYYVKEDLIKKHNLSWAVRGMNSVGKPHPTVHKLLLDKQLDPNEIVTIDTVPVKTVKTLLEENNVQSIGFLKIDTEGHDCMILNNYIDYCVDHLHLLADKIEFETNDLSQRSDIESTIKRLEKMNYKMLKSDENTLLIKKPSWA